MSRAVVVATVSDILFDYWMKNYETWKEYTDKLYVVGKDKPYPKGVEDVLKDLQEDTVLIMHDDVFVYNKGELNTYFSLAEQGKVVTPLHKNYSKIAEVEEMMLREFGKIVAFFPEFLFIIKENLYPICSWVPILIKWE